MWLDIPIQFFYFNPIICRFAGGMWTDMPYLTHLASGWVAYRQAAFHVHAAVCTPGMRDVSGSGTRDNLLRVGHKCFSDQMEFFFSMSHWHRGGEA